MTNKELATVVCGAIEDHRQQGTAFSRDGFAALVKMMQALYPHTTYEQQIAVTARMKVIVDPLDGFHPHWEPEDLFAACVKAVEAKPESHTVPYEEAVIFINGIDMALKRLAPKAEACSCLAALAEKR